ncbi:AAA family protein [Toxoplasma gondii CAST]|uniref:AAA family protein n=1 Tax=Toxoplasma gondii CAST TaxID=943122 RepID=A0A425HP44_TOXGO|nr:AAA family protein [Toxoplasma gondii CAST]
MSPPTNCLAVQLPLSSPSSASSSFFVAAPLRRGAIQRSASASQRPRFVSVLYRNAKLRASSFDARVKPLRLPLSLRSVLNLSSPHLARPASLFALSSAASCASQSRRLPHSPLSAGRWLSGPGFLASPLSVGKRLCSRLLGAAPSELFRGNMSGRGFAHGGSLDGGGSREPRSAALASADSQRAPASARRGRNFVAGRRGSQGFLKEGTAAFASLRNGPAASASPQASQQLTHSAGTPSLPRSQAATPHPAASSPLCASPPAASPSPAAEESVSLEKLFGGMGHPQFNKHIVDDENILHFYGIRQAVLRPVVHEDCSRGASAAHASSPPANSRRGKEPSQNQFFKATLSWTISGKRKIQTEGVGRSKKDAKKDAVKTLLSQLGPVTLHEYEQVTRCLFSSLRGKIHGKQASFPTGSEHRFMWTFMSGGEEVRIESTGRGNSACEAEIAAMQDMYLKVLKYKDCQTEERENINRQVTQARQQQAAEARGKGAYPGAHLSKQDAGEINQQHHNLTTRNQIKPTEAIAVSAEGYRCNLEWRWVGRDGRSRTLSVVGIGSSKPLARASAALQMMANAGFVEHVEAPDRQAARSLLNLLAERPEGKVYVAKACALIEATTSAVWRLFLPTVWRAALAENERSLIDALLRTMKTVTAAAADEGTSSPASGSRAMPPDVWEQLLDECTVLTNCNFGQAILHELGDVLLEQSYFPSPLARQYFQNYRLMLALEWQAQLATGIEDRKAYGDMFEGKHMILNCKSATMPVFSLGTALKAEDREFLANVQFREDDCVLLRPFEEQRSSDETERKCFVGVVTSVKSDGVNFNVNVRLASGEGAKHADILTCRRFKLYYLTPAVTHDRMVEALRSLTMHRMPISHSTSSYAFTPEIRYLLLHTGEPPAKEVASRGPVPLLSDVDPSHFDPLHRLNELADAQAQLSRSSSSNRDDTPLGSSALQNTKKQRLQQSSAVSCYPPPSSLLSQVAMQARSQLTDRNDFTMPSPEIDLSDVVLPTGLPLTRPQKAACLSALTNRLTLVQGPPGTGKTHVACAIIDAWQRNDPSKKILAVADSNVAADNLMEGLSARGIRSVRVGNGSESDLQEEAIADLGRYRDYVRLKQNGMFGEAKTVRMALFREAIRRQPVIIATCVGSGHEMFDDLVFSRVIIDEGAQAIEPSNLIPLAHGCRNFVLIGDHKQLPPTILSPEAAARGLDVSLLERFVGSGIAPIQLLDEQRRMHPSIAYFPNLQFYDGKIQSRDVDDGNRPPVAGFRWPSQHSRVCLVDISAAGLSGSETSQGTSKYNAA